MMWSIKVALLILIVHRDVSTAQSSGNPEPKTCNTCSYVDPYQGSNDENCECSSFFGDKLKILIIGSSSMKYCCKRPGLAKGKSYPRLCGWPIGEGPGNTAIAQLRQRYPCGWDVAKFCRPNEEWTGMAGQSEPNGSPVWDFCCCARKSTAHTTTSTTPTTITPSTPRTTNNAEPDIDSTSTTVSTTDSTTDSTTTPSANNEDNDPCRKCEHHQISLRNENGDKDCYCEGTSLKVKLTLVNPSRNKYCCKESSLPAGLSYPATCDWPKGGGPGNTNIAILRQKYPCGTSIAKFCQSGEDWMGAGHINIRTPVYEFCCCAKKSRRTTTTTTESTPTSPTIDSTPSTPTSPKPKSTCETCSLNPYEGSDDEDCDCTSAPRGKLTRSILSPPSKKYCCIKYGLPDGANYPKTCYWPIGVGPGNTPIEQLKRRYPCGDDVAKSCRSGEVWTAGSREEDRSNVFDFCCCASKSLVTTKKPRN